MSYRHTYITEFIYKAGDPHALKEIEEALGEYCDTVHWKGRDGMGYFHGVIKDLNGQDTALEQEEIIRKLAKRNVRIKIVLE